IDRLTRKFQSVRSKVNLEGLTNAMSVLLRKEYGELEVTDGFRREQKLRRERISEAQLRQLELDDQRVDLFDVDAEARRVVDEIDPEGTREDRAELEAAARSLLANRKEHLDALLADYLVYLERLVDL